MQLTPVKLLLSFILVIFQLIYKRKQNSNLTMDLVVGFLTVWDCVIIYMTYIIPFYEPIMPTHCPYVPHLSLQD